MFNHYQSLELNEFDYLMTCSEKLRRWRHLKNISIFHSFYKYFLIQVESCDKWLLLVDTGIWAAIDIVSSADRILRGTDLEHCTWIDDISLLTSDRSGRLLLRSSIDDLAVVIILSATVSLSSCTWSVILSRTPEIFWNVKIGILFQDKALISEGITDNRLLKISTQLIITLDSLPMASTTQSIALLPLFALDDTVFTIIDSM